MKKDLIGLWGWVSKGFAMAKYIAISTWYDCRESIAKMAEERRVRRARLAAAIDDMPSDYPDGVIPEGRRKSYRSTAPVREPGSEPIRPVVD